MRKTKLILAGFLAVMFLSSVAQAQKFKVLSGDAKVLSGAAKVNVQFDYSQMSVGKFADESEYISKKKGEYNEKESGKGDKWEADWKADRMERYEPQFLELFNNNSKTQAGDFPDAPYTLLVKTTRTEPGYNIHISRKNAEIDGEVWIVDTKNPAQVLAKISFEKSKGRSFGGYDYDTGYRIQEAYALLGKSLAKFLK